jgi:hypothetical protein
MQVFEKLIASLAAYGKIPLFEMQGAVSACRSITEWERASMSK